MSGIPISTVIARWGRIGCLGFGGPPAHVAMLRELCVEEQRWVDDESFEHAVAATNLLPGPASTQLAILLAHRVGGPAAAVAGGLAFILPGLVAMLGLAAAVLSGPPAWLRGAGAGAAAAVPLVALHAGAGLLGPSRRRAVGGTRLRWWAYLAAGAAAGAAVPQWLVVVLVGCGLVELATRRAAPTAAAAISPLPLAAVVAALQGGLGSLGWTALKAGALSYGGGFVIVPMMRGDAVGAFGWMTPTEFSSAVALGQVTPGPVLHTVAAVGYGAHGMAGALLAAVIAFAPSFVFVLASAGRIERLTEYSGALAFMAGAGPAAIGGILGAAVLLADALTEPWQWALSAASALLLLSGRAGVVAVLLLTGGAGAAIVLAGGTAPG